MISFIDKIIQTIVIMLLSIILFTAYSLILIRLLCSNTNIICKN
jgi:hypothetical protein